MWPCTSAVAATASPSFTEPDCRRPWPRPQASAGKETVGAAALIWRREVVPPSLDPYPPTDGRLESVSEGPSSEGGPAYARPTSQARRGERPARAICTGQQALITSPP